MKLQATKKEIKNGYYRVLAIGYCDAQNLLRYENAFAYSAGVYGWGCDYYDIDGVCISTGYRTINQNMRSDYKVIRDYEARAEKLPAAAGREARRELIVAMLKDLEL
jgi:hypothetical protein